jgi:hypothetical protein
MRPEGEWLLATQTDAVLTHTREEPSIVPSASGGRAQAAYQTPGR